jgi:SAM-dependent methyltransferase
MSHAAVAVFAAALRRAARGQHAPLRLLAAADPRGEPLRRLDASWYERLRPGDTGLLDRCEAETLDVGCGPGRLAGALTAERRRALGVDLSGQAVRFARRRGAPALHRNVFDPLPAEGHWRSVLLADGNIGIGGDPERLLRRCRALAAGDGAVLVEVEPPGAPSWRGELALCDGYRTSTAFRWAFVSADDIAAEAERAALRVAESWTEAERWFVRLTRA